MPPPHPSYGDRINLSDCDWVKLQSDAFTNYCSCSWHVPKKALWHCWVVARFCCLLSLLAACVAVADIVAAAVAAAAVSVTVSVSVVAAVAWHSFRSIVDAVAVYCCCYYCCCCVLALILLLLLLLGGRNVNSEFFYHTKVLPVRVARIICRVARLTVSTTITSVLENNTPSTRYRTHRTHSVQKVSRIAHFVTQFLSKSEM